MNRRARRARHPALRRWLILAKRIAVVALSGAALAFALLCWQIDRTGRTDQARPVDAIVVLGAKVNADGTPGQDLVDRTRHGVALYQAGFADVLLFTGGRGAASAAQQGRALAISLGVPPGSAWAVEGAWETRGDAQTSAVVLQANNWDSVLLVTHPLHCYRARHFFRQQGMRALVSPTGPVQQVPQPWRAYYTVREAVGVIWPLLRLPARYTMWLQEEVYGDE